jgi:ribosomal 30S subunit maturation factor RimM
MTITHLPDRKRRSALSGYGVFVRRADPPEPQRKENHFYAVDDVWQTVE